MYGSARIFKMQYFQKKKIILLQSKQLYNLFICNGLEILNLSKMKKLLSSLFILTIILITGQKIFAQNSLYDNTEFTLFPENPGPNDSVYFSFTYISTDGCPDFTARIDSTIDNKINIKLERIVDSTRMCILVISKFKIRLNLGIIQRPTDIYLNSKLIKTFGGTEGDSTG